MSSIRIHKWWQIEGKRGVDFERKAEVQLPEKEGMDAGQIE